MGKDCLDFLEREKERCFDLEVEVEVDVWG